MIVGYSRSPVPPDQTRRPRRRTAFWRWLKAPRLSIADGLVYVSLTLAADALKLSSGLPWPVVLAVVLAFTTAFMFLAGFLKGFGRSVRGRRR
jgi:hypothetical protein